MTPFLNMTEGPAIYGIMNRFFTCMITALAAGLVCGCMDGRTPEPRAGDIPLRLFARASLAEYVHPDDWFIPTIQGFDFFQRYFDIPYPFGKYDQVIVPHFNAGAMENVGAVTFSERYLRRGTVTRADRRSLASVILHEMAHMWFGNLVTIGASHRSCGESASILAKTPA